MTKTVSTTPVSGGADQPVLPRFWLLVAAALAIQAVLAIDCARQWTPTHDEYWHLPIGLRMWKFGSFDDDVINPPPVRLWAALPLYLGGANAGDFVRLDVGDIGDAFWRNNTDQFRMWFLLGRLMIIPLGTVTGCAIAAWSRSWYGDRAALVSVLLWVCCPTALANSAIVTHDLPLAAAWTVALWMLVRFAQRPSWKRAILFGVTLGLAPLAKLTGLLLFPLSPLLWLILRWRAGPATAAVPKGSVDAASLEPHPFRQIVGWWIVALSTSLFVLNAGYLFRQTGPSLRKLNLVSSQAVALQETPLGVIPLPFPQGFLRALDRLFQDLEARHPVYLDGQWSDRPFSRYYVAALSDKLPISTLILLLIGLAAVGWPRPQSRDRRHGLFLLVAALTLPILASGSSNQIGIRYILPALPLLCIFAGQSARWIGMPRQVLASTSTRWLGRLVWIAVLAAPLSLRFHPHHLAYFNLLAGGPVGGRWHLVDSNLDWGQDLFALRDYLEKHHVQDVGIAYFGTVPPMFSKTRTHLPPPHFPQPGWYAISVNFVQGRPHVIRDSNGNRTQVGLEEFRYFRFFEPVARIGYSIDVYRLSQQDVARYAHALQESQ